jgi:hypothetical protein
MNHGFPLELPTKELISPSDPKPRCKSKYRWWATYKYMNHGFPLELPTKELISPSDPKP